MLSTTSSPVVRSIGLICFLLLTLIYLVRVRNESDEAILDHKTPSVITVATATIQDADAYEKRTTPVLSAGRHSIGNRGSETSHSHEHGRTPHHLAFHEDDELEVQLHTSKSGVGGQEEKDLKYHTKVFGSPWGSGGQLGLKTIEDAPGHKKGYGTPVETPGSADINLGQKKAYYA